MKRRVSLIFVAATLLVSSAAFSAPGGKPATVKGYVLDSACAFVKNLQKPLSPECAVSCAKAGSPLVILTETGMIYWPISSSMPASGENKRLLPYAGKEVTVEGEVYEKGGSHAIVIAKISGAGAKP